MKKIPTMIDGQTSLMADDFNQIPSELENAIIASGLSLDGGDLNQLGKVFTKSSCGYDFYEDTGIPNAIILNAFGKQPLVEYVNGLKIRFNTSNTNTGSTTVNIDGLGAKRIIDTFNNSLTPNTIVTNNYYEIVFNSSSDNFVLLNTHFKSPVGSIIISPNGDVYSGYFKADGSEISRTTYKTLFDVYGTFFGIGDGSTTFNLPDYRGLFLRGLGGLSAEVNVLQGDSIRNITGRTNNLNGDSGGATGCFTGAQGASQGGTGTARHIAWSNFDASSVVNTANENRPTNKAVRYLVQYR